jgi:hypothetical protein
VGSSSTEVTTITVPVGLSGRYHLGAIVDSEGAVTESNEADNVTLGSATVIGRVEPVYIDTRLSTSRPAFGKPFTVYGKLSAQFIEGPGLPSEFVEIQRSAGGTDAWSTEAFTVTDGSGYFRWSGRSPDTASVYRVFFRGKQGIHAATIGELKRVSPQVDITAPIAPEVMSRNRPYAVHGYLRPKHDAGTYPVRVYLYRRVGGTWKSTGYIAARAVNDSSFTMYVCSVRLSRAGSWRLRAYAPADRRHAATWSHNYVSVLVK